MPVDKWHDVIGEPSFADAILDRLAKACDLENVAEREVYAALDWLLDQQLRIETALARKHLKGGALVLYDVSSSYLEGCCCELAQHGYSRDHRSDRPQIVYGLLCAADGVPVLRSASSWLISCWSAIAA